MTQYYSIINAIGAILLLIYNLLQFKKKREFLSTPSHAAIGYFNGKDNVVAKILAKPGFWTIIEICVISCLQYICVGFLNTQTARIFNTGANYFGIIYYAPLIVFVFCMLVKINPLKQLDLITPAYPLALTVVKISCQVTGCCRGVKWIYGLYNPSSNQIEFPAPLLEAAVALLLFVFLHCFRKKFKKGTMFPIYLTAYSGIRFFTEFLRCEPNILWGLKAYHFFCIVGVVLGVIEYWAVCKYGTWIEQKAERKIPQE